MKHLLLLCCYSILLVSTVSSTFPCSQYGSDLYGEINCLRRLLSQCTTEKTNREPRTIPPPAISTTTVPSTMTPSTTSTTTSTTTTTAPTTTQQWMDEVNESSDDWPTPNSALIIDALKYELAREIENKIREANEKFDAKMGAYQVQVEMEMKKINKEVRMLKVKIHRRGSAEYMLSEERESWYTAGEICTRWGGHLVSISSIRENQFVASLLPTGESAWIGLNDIQNEDQFVNADGAQTSYRNWEKGQPDNMHHNENCIEIMSREGKWRDSLCLLTKRFVCTRWMEWFRSFSPPSLSMHGLILLPLLLFLSLLPQVTGGTVKCRQVAVDLSEYANEKDGESKKDQLNKYYGQLTKESTGGGVIECDDYCVQNITHTDGKMWLIGGCGTAECASLTQEGQKAESIKACLRGSAMEKTHVSLYHYSCCCRDNLCKTAAWIQFLLPNYSQFLSKTAAQSLPREEIKTVVYVRTGVAALFAVAAIATQVVAVRLYSKKQ